jgi:hypothetical protein
MTNRARLRKYGLVAAMVVFIAVGGFLGGSYVLRAILSYTAEQGHQN